MRHKLRVLKHSLNLHKISRLFGIIKNGILDENPIFRLVLGTCPTLAVTTSATNGLGMGLATAAVLICSNFVISILRKAIPSTVRIPAYITVIAGFVTIVQMLLKAYFPALDKALGIYIPLIVVNCIILARAESFASKNGPIASIADGLGMGLGFAIALTIIGAIREIFGNGSIFGLALFGEAASPALMMILPPGGFLVYGIVIGIVNKITDSKTSTPGCKGCAKPCPQQTLEEEVN
jgi:electron transport complex protein RnfE